MIANRVDDHKEAAGYDASCTVLDECHAMRLRSRRANWAASAGQILACRARCDANSQLEPEFAGNSGFAPDRVLSSHGADEFPQVARQLGSATRSGPPPPEQAKSIALSPDESVRLGHEERELFAQEEIPGGQRGAGPEDLVRRAHRK